MDSALGKVATGIAFCSAAVICHAGSPDTCVSSDYAFGCQTEEQIDKVLQYKADPEAFKKVLIVAIAGGFCAMIEKGSFVYVDDHTFLSERSKVRRPGELTAFWVPTKQLAKGSDCIAVYNSTHAATPPPEAPHVSQTPKYTPSPPQKAQPAPPEKQACEIKPVMTDEDIARCR